MMRLAILLLISLTALCEGPVAGRKPPVAAHARSGAAARTSDAEIEKAVRARFARSKIAADKFSVSVQGGVATIEGQTAVIQRKGTATRLAKAAGAIAVVNKVKLSEEARRKAAANLEKGRRRAQVKRSEVPGR